MGHGCDVASATTQSRWCFRRCDLAGALAGAGMRRDQCDLAGGGVRCSGAICGCGAIWDCVRNLANSTLSSCSWFSSFFSFFFFFLNGLKVNLEIGFGPWGGKIWASRSMAKVSLDMGFRPCEECA